MFKILCKSLLASPAILAAALVISPAANAAEDATKNEFNLKAAMPLEIAQASPDATLEQLENYSNEGQEANNSENQLTSVNELKDVAPTEWAYEALRSLVERYGCIVGYPDATFRGNRALTRWEFAAGLNACMNTMERLIQENVAVLKEDIDKLKRLMQEFEAELAALGARVDNLEGRVSFLEDNQFSTTTKLQGEVIFAVSDTFGDADKTQTVFVDRVRLALNTSFDGEDRLVTRLAAGNSRAFDTSVSNDFGDFSVGPSPTTTQTFNLSPSDDNDVFIDWLAYYKPIKISDDFTINTYTAAWGGIWSDIAPTSNPFFEDYGGGNGALSTFASENPIYSIGGGAGLAVNFELFDFLQVTGGYLAGGANDPNEGSGLFNGDYGGLVQLNYSPIEELELGLTYVHAFHKAGNPIFGYGGGTPVVGTSLVQDLAFDGDRVTNNYGAQLAWRFLDNVSFSAYGAYGDIQGVGDNNFASEYWTYGAGFAVTDLGKEGSILGIFAGVQPYLGDGDELPGRNNLNPIHVEAFYKYQLTDNISITPGVIWISNPEQIDGSNDSVIGTIRTTFTF